MVKQREGRKASSKKWPTREYAFQCFIALEYFAPEEITTTPGEIASTGYTDKGYTISGYVAAEPKNGYHLEFPHLAFANLRAGDPRSAETFIRRYGQLDPQCTYYQWKSNPQAMRDLRNHLKEAPLHKLFMLESADVQSYQSELRAAWRGDMNAILKMKANVNGNMEVDILLGASGGIQLRPNTLWACMCFLLLEDYLRKTLGICANPDCVAPHFIKKRKTQKYCEAGPCVDYGHRKDALRYWNTKGKKKREIRSKRRAKGRSYDL